MCLPPRTYITTRHPWVPLLVIKVPKVYFNNKPEYRLTNFQYSWSSADNDHSRYHFFKPVFFFLCYSLPLVFDDVSTIAAAKILHVQG